MPKKKGMTKMNGKAKGMPKVHKKKGMPKMYGKKK